jgi:HSP20 family protein
MSNRLQWDIRHELGNLRDNMNRILEEGIASVSGGTITLDMYETEDSIVVETNPIPGVTPESFEVAITGNVLTIKGESKESPDQHKENANYLRKERRFGHFSRSITIPVEVNAEEAAASFKDGILTITIPKTVAEQPKVINVSSTDND